MIGIDIAVEKAGMLEKLTSLEGAVTAHQKEKAQSTINQFFLIAENLEALSEIADESLRNREINRICGGGAEDGFSQTIQALAERINIFVSTYHTADAADKAAEFFACFSAGDPCLNGRSESLFKFAAQLTAGIDVDSLSDPSKKLELPAVALAAFTEEKFDGSAREEEVLAAISADVAEFAEHFTPLTRNDTLQKASFLDYLDESLLTGAVINREAIDWNVIATAITKPDIFSTIYRLSQSFIF